MGQLLIYYIINIIWFLLVIQFLTFSSSPLSSLTNSVSALYWWSLSASQEKKKWLWCLYLFPFQQESETGTHLSLEKIIAEYTEYWMLRIRKVLCAEWSRSLHIVYLVAIVFLAMNRCLDRKYLSGISPWLFQVDTHVALLMSLLFFNNIRTMFSVCRACLSPCWYNWHHGTVICLLIWCTYACVACERIWGDAAVP